MIACLNSIRIPCSDSGTNYGPVSTRYGLPATESRKDTQGPLTDLLERRPRLRQAILVLLQRGRGLTELALRALDPRVRLACLLAVPGLRARIRKSCGDPGTKYGLVSTRYAHHVSILVQARSKPGPGASAGDMTSWLCGAAHCQACTTLFARPKSSHTPGFKTALLPGPPGKRSIHPQLECQ